MTLFKLPQHKHNDLPTRRILPCLHTNAKHPGRVRSRPFRGAVLTGDKPRNADLIDAEDPRIL